MKLSGICKSYGELKVLDGLDLDIPQNGILGIEGPSGCGKTTLLRIIAGLEKPDAGSIEDPFSHVSMLFEDDRLFGWMDPLANVCLAGCTKSRALELLERLGIADKAHADLDALSGGQQRRVALARALAHPADALLLDEPTLRLDADRANDVIGLVRELWPSAPVVLVTHDHAIASQCDQLFGYNWQIGSH